MRALACKPCTGACDDTGARSHSPCRMVGACFDKCIEKRCAGRMAVAAQGICVGGDEVVLTHTYSSLQVQGRRALRGREPLHRPVHQQVLAGDRHRRPDARGAGPDAVSPCTCRTHPILFPTSCFLGQPASQLFSLVPCRRQAPLPWSQCVVCNRRGWLIPALDAVIQIAFHAEVMRLKLRKGIHGAEGEVNGGYSGVASCPEQSLRGASLAKVKNGLQGWVERLVPLVQRSGGLE